MEPVPLLNHSALYRSPQQCTVHCTAHSSSALCTELLTTTVVSRVGGQALGSHFMHFIVTSVEQTGRAAGAPTQSSILCYINRREGDAAENLNIWSSCGAAEYSLIFQTVLPGGRVQFGFSNCPAERLSPIDKPASADRSGNRNRNLPTAASSGRRSLVRSSD